jgi:hypothetical protein
LQIFFVIGCLLLKVGVKAKDDLIYAGSKGVDVTLFIWQKTSRLQLFGRHVGYGSLSRCRFLAFALELGDSEVAKLKDRPFFENVDWFDVLMYDTSLQESDQAIGHLVEKVKDLVFCKNGSKFLGPIIHERPRLAIFLKDIQIIFGLKMFFMSLDKVRTIGQTLDNFEFLQILPFNLIILDFDDLDSKHLISIGHILRLIDLGILALSNRIQGECIFILSAGFLVMQGQYLHAFLHQVIIIRTSYNYFRFN